LITLAPLPNWKSLLKGISPFAQDKSTLSIPWQNEGDIAGWFSRSAWSLARIALWRSQINNSETLNVWIPDYFCNAALAPLRCTNVEFTFYPVNSKREPDYNALYKLANINQPDIFLLVHYFGYPTATKPAFDFCSKFRAWMIEDAAHILQPIPGNRNTADFILYSPHKLLPIPDGALLIVRPNGPSMLGNNISKKFGKAETWAEDLSMVQKWPLVSIQNRFLFTRTWMAKRILQKLGINRRIKKTDFMKVDEKHCKQQIVLPEPEMSDFSCRIFGTINTNLNHVVRLRQQNELKWREKIEEIFKDDLKSNIHDNKRIGSEFTPYLVPMFVDTESGQNIVEFFENHGVPVMIWPDLPPEVFKNKDKHLEALALRLSNIFLPCHQTLYVNNFLNKIII
jgi:hypothetical protein